MNKKLYVGNLNYSTTEEELRRLFSEVGPVASVFLVTDKETGRPRGFGFVEMETVEAAQQAIQKLDGREVDQYNIKVNEANPPRERSFGGGGGGGNRQGGGGGGGYRQGGGGGGGNRQGGGGGGGNRRRY